MDDLDAQLLRFVRTSARASAGSAAKALGIARMTAFRRLNAHVEQGVLVRAGERGRNVHYAIAPFRQSWRRIGLDENEAWKRVEPIVRARWAVDGDELDAVHYVFTELVNNAIDHSDASKVEVTLDVDQGLLRLVVVDDGIGAFERVRSEAKLPSLSDAIVQLEKGKQTTMPSRHSGEGIFFASKIASEFRLEANGHAWLVDNEAHDTMVLGSTLKRGTRVVARFRPGSIPKLEGVFGRYTEDGAFTKTKTSVKLVAFGDRFISRSEAKRVAHGLEKFSHVTVDFAGVVRVGQGFVDELFRVFASDHPGIVLEPVNMTDDVALMVNRGRAMATTAIANSELTLPAPFAAMEPVPVMAAVALIERARASTSPRVAFSLASYALDALVHRHRFWGELAARHDVGQATLRAEVDASAAHYLEVVTAAVHRIIDNPQLWPWFIDDDAIDRFFALPGDRRAELWGEAIER